MPIPWHRRFLGIIVVDFVSAFLVLVVVIVLGLVAYEFNQVVISPATAETQRRIDQRSHEYQVECADPSTKCDPSNRGDELDKFVNTQFKPVQQPARRQR